MFSGPIVVRDAPVILPGNIVIGERGLAYDRDQLGCWVPKKQEFGVVIEAFVDIGANTVIHQGGWRDTHIKSGTKIGSLVNIGHNVLLGENCLIAPMVTIGGSVEVGDGVRIWQNASIAQRLKIGDGAEIGMGAVVICDIPPGEVWVGNPARRLR